MRKETMRNYVWDIMNDRISGWRGKGVAAFLKGCAFVYRFGVLTVSWLYAKRLFPSCALGRPTICVGNITVGGTGKTPVVQWVVSYLKFQGLKPAVLTRGYMARTGTGPKGQFSDEAVLLFESLNVPVIVDPNRCRGAARAIHDHNPDVFVMDDGFQHWRARRDLDIVVINAANPFGNGEVLPRGILREPLSALKRADLFILNKVDVAGDRAAGTESLLKRMFPATPVVSSVYGIAGCQDLGGKDIHLSAMELNEPVFVVSSIGDPQSFQSTLLKCSIGIAGSRHFPDHHMYTEKDIVEVCDAMHKAGVQRLCVTHKDAVKLRSFQKEFQDRNIACLVILIQVVIDHGKEQLCSRIRNLRPV